MSEWVQRFYSYFIIILFIDWIFYITFFRRLYEYKDSCLCRRYCCTWWHPYVAGRCTRCRGDPRSSVWYDTEKSVTVGLRTAVRAWRRCDNENDISYTVVVGYFTSSRLGIFTFFTLSLSLSLSISFFLSPFLSLFLSLSHALSLSLTRNLSMAIYIFLSLPLSLSLYCLFYLADEMLSRGFKEQIYDVFKFMPETVQCTIFSATMPLEVLEVRTWFPSTFFAASTFSFFLLTTVS